MKDVSATEFDKHATSKERFLPKLQQYRAIGPIEDYKFDALKPKKQMKEIRKVLLPERKRFFS